VNIMAVECFLIVVFGPVVVSLVAIMTYAYLPRTAHFLSITHDHRF
jgi:hypothetical protein